MAISPLHATKRYSNGYNKYNALKPPVKLKPRPTLSVSAGQRLMQEREASRQREECCRTAAGICCSVGVLLMLDNCWRASHN